MGKNWRKSKPFYPPKTPVLGGYDGYPRDFSGNVVGGKCKSRVMSNKKLNKFWEFLWLCRTKNVKNEKITHLQNEIQLFIPYSLESFKVRIQFLVQENSNKKTSGAWALAHSLNALRKWLKGVFFGYFLIQTLVISIRLWRARKCARARNFCEFEFFGKNRWLLHQKRIQNL